MYVVFGKGEEIHDILIRNGYEFSLETCQDFLDVVDPDYDIGTSNWEDRVELEEMLADIVAKDIEDFLENDKQGSNGFIIYTMHETVYNELFNGQEG